MIISQIAEIGKKKRVVYIDGEEAFTLYKNEIYKYELLPDTVLTEEKYEEIMAVLNKRAKLKIMEYLKQSDKSETELRNKLKRALFPDSCIQVAIDYVKQYGYINDTHYAENYIYSHKNNKSKQALEFDLRRKGISSEIIKSCMEQEYDPDTEIEAIRKQIAKKCSDVSSLSSEQKVKLLASICRKGFSYENVKRCLSIMEEEDLY